jgi:hypothetical protein
VRGRKGRETLIRGFGFQDKKMSGWGFESLDPCKLTNYWIGVAFGLSLCESGWAGLGSCNFFGLSCIPGDFELGGLLFWVRKFFLAFTPLPINSSRISNFFSLNSDVSTKIEGNKIVLLNARQ